MIFIKKYLQLKKINIFIIMSLLATLSCSGPQVITTGAGAAIAAAEDEKTLGDVFDDTSISIGIKDRVFMYEAILLTKIGVDVEKGKVLLTGILKDQNQRVEVVRFCTCGYRRQCGGHFIYPHIQQMAAAKQKPSLRISARLT